MNVAAEPKQVNTGMDQPIGGQMAKAPVHAPTVITTADDFRASRQEWMQQSFHVLTPVADFRALPPHFGLMPAKVQINPDPAAGEVYADKLFCEPGEVALTKNGLSKIAMAAGMSIRTERTDGRRIQNLWEVRATARFIGLDGTPQDLDATEELDLRDGTDRSKKILGRNNAVGALVATRAKGLRNCEARAVNAAIRLFGIKQKYTAKELAKPFVVLRVMFMPDMTDPATRAFMTERALQGTTMMYPSAGRGSLPPAEPELLDTIGDVVGDEPRAVGRSATTEPAAALPDVSVLIKDVRIEEKQRRDKTGSFKKWVVATSTGEEHVTIKREIGEALQRAHGAQTAVELATEENSYGESEVLEVIPVAGDSQQGLPSLGSL